MRVFVLKSTDGGSGTITVSAPDGKTILVEPSSAAPVIVDAIELSHAVTACIFERKQAEKKKSA